jgi:tetratricopeptide (TPR) repeat protein
MTDAKTAPDPIAVAQDLLKSGRLTDAWAAVVAACKAAPQEPRAWLVRADVARAAGDLDALALALERAIPLIDSDAVKERLALDRAWALAHIGRRAHALQVVRQLLPRLSGTESRRLAARVLDALGLQQEALPLFEAVTEAEPGEPGGWYNLGIALRALGETGPAARAFERALSVHPGHPPSLAALAALEPRRPQLAERLAAATAARPQPQLDIALFQVMDALDRPAEAWTALQRANEAARKANPWSADEESALIDQLIARFPAERFRASSDFAATPRPVFITGLPRTGTTLVERVLAAHSQVRALGELDSFGALFSRAAGTRSQIYADPGAVARSEQVDWAALSRSYRAEVAAFADGRPVVLDKLPQNWIYAGPIALALPDAVIVSLDRGPMDALFGAYKQLFRRDHRWSYAFEDLAAHYANHRRLMAHWKEALGPRLVKVSYEALVRDPRRQIPRLVEACGLKMEPACLEPHRAEGAVRTLSVTQVREPISAKGVGAWRRYAAQLEPLRASLQAAGFVDAKGERV